MLAQDWSTNQRVSSKRSFENGSKRRNRRSVEFFPYDTPPEDILETLKELDAEPPIDIYVGDELVAENVTDVSKLVADDVTATSPKPLDMELMDPIIDKYDGLTTFLPVFPAQSQGFTDIYLGPKVSPNGVTKNLRNLGRTVRESLSKVPCTIYLQVQVLQVPLFPSNQKPTFHWPMNKLNC